MNPSDGLHRIRTAFSVSAICVAAALALAFSLSAQVHRTPETPAATDELLSDPRGVLWIDFNCKSEINQRRVSLFASGTLRLRTEGIEETRVRLAELAPHELSGFLHRLAAEDLSETDAETWSPGGAWIERCRLEMTLPGRPAESFGVDRFGSVSLGLSRVLAIVKELDRLVEERSPPSRHLSAEYRPRSGDVLERADGAKFRVVGYTMDKLGVELVGVDLPLTVFIHFDDVRKQFVALVSRREP